MKAIFLKEFRENIKWAALAMLAMGGFIEWAIRNSPAPELLGDAFFFATISGFSAIALALGLLQIFQDQMRGREAFIAHRPIKRSTVFWGKVLAGLLLYFLAAGVPLVISIVWCYEHRYHTAPFEWRMALPGIWDLINGTVVYFAALLIGSREAKWFGSRLMPLSIPFLFTSIGYIFAENIGEALVITAIALLIVIPAAWSSFVHRGIFEAQSLYIRVAQTAIITLGLLICVWTACGFLLSNLGWDPSRKWTGWDYIIDDNGHLIRRIIENSQLGFESK